jgi:DNA-binding LacI/PurR family transcriptional regulator
MAKRTSTFQDHRDCTIRDVAKEAGVSVATAGRVIGGYGSVSAKASTAVMGAVKKLNYIPNGVAQSMKKKNTKTIGLIIANINNPYFSSIARMVEEFLVKEGYNMIICNTDEDSEREISYLKTLYEKRIDGLMIASALKNSEKSQEEIERIYRGSVPTIIIDRDIPSLDLPTVTSDNFRGAYEATSHLIKQGHKKIGVIGANISTLFRRVDGCKEAMKDNLLPSDSFLIASETNHALKPGDISEGIQATKVLLQDPGTRPTAIIALNNLLTIGSLIAIEEMGLTIPDDVAVIGWDDFDLAPLLKPPITVVKQSAYNIAQIASNRLLELIMNPDQGFGTDKKVVLATELVVRGSCGYKGK